LDLGVGEGVFAISAYRRLCALGADEAAAASQIHGAEQEEAVLERAQEIARQEIGQGLPNVVCADFCETELPAANAVVGNPPYIRRHYIKNPAKMRIAANLPHADGLTDAYCYFLLRAGTAMRTGGRLAVVVSGSWLDMNYGRGLKRLLLDQFQVRLLLWFEGRVFSNALVKPVVILAERSSGNGQILFARLKSTTPLVQLSQVIGDVTSGKASPHAILSRVSLEELSPRCSWSSFIKAPDVYDDLCRGAPLTRLRHVGNSRIGLQTFAKRFYILTKGEAGSWGIEPEYLFPLAFSPRNLKLPVIADPDQLRHRVFACGRPESELLRTGAGRYIANGKLTRVRVRGRAEFVDGYHNAPRLARAGRQPWYNLRTTIERRKHYPILLPRRIFESYLVVQSQAGVVANEDFIEVSPYAGEPWVGPLLAFFNSSMGEFLVRSHSFQYGGGIFNLNPGAVRDIPVPDPAELPSDSRARLDAAWNSFVVNFGDSHARPSLDQEVAGAFGISPSLQARVDAALNDLIIQAGSATSAH
jgi:hypothetical protein